MAFSDTVGGVTRTPSGSEHRLALAQKVIALLRRALPPSSQLEFVLASDAPPERYGVEATGITLSAAQDVAQLLLERPAANGPADLPLRPWWLG